MTSIWGMRVNSELRMIMIAERHIVIVKSEHTSTPARKAKAHMETDTKESQRWTI